ncbi:MAG: DUF4476 domain-containing protein [Flavobacteriales bacterium]|nr:DUF4476 domain-containing protein [Flavobacteriales bacterium]
MKSTITQMTVLIISLTLMSFLPNRADASQLNLRMFNGSTFTLWLNGERIARATPEANINQLRAGQHHIKVVKVVRSQYDGRRVRRVIYDGFVDIPRRKRITAVVHPRRGLRFTSIVHIPRRVDYAPPPPPPGPTCGAVPGSFWFDDLKATILNASFDRDRLRIAQQGLNGRNVTAAEVSDLMNCFNFESTRLKFAKYAYGRTLDPENYYLVNNSFRFSSSIDRLHHFIGSF